MTVLRMGTRGSALALAQSKQVGATLEQKIPGLKVDTTIIKTSGDIHGAPIGQAARNLAQGAKGYWVKEIEEALLDGRIDFAVHSAKDLPAVSPEALIIAAYPPREDARDVMVARPGITWGSLIPGMKVATSSLRRQMAVRAAKPGVELVALTGNVDTRLRKLEQNQFDAMIVAMAGLKRLNREEIAREVLDPQIMIPAPAQGALALQLRHDRQDVLKLISVLDDNPTRECVEIERLFLRLVEGGCGSPVAAYARKIEEKIVFDGFFAHYNEEQGRRVHGVCKDNSNRTDWVTSLVKEVLARP